MLDGTNTLSFAAAVDPLRAANRQAGKTLFDWDFATPTAAPVALTSGIEIPARAVQGIDRTDLLIVVAGFDLEAQCTPQLMASLRRLARGDTFVAGIDGGPWVMAKAGLLDGHRATTHWEDLESFATYFSQIQVKNARYVVSDRRLTSGGAAPAIEMMLHLIGTQHGTTLARKIAGSFIFDPRAAPQTPQSRVGGLPHDATTARAHALMEAALETPRPLSQIAKALRLSPRSLQQHFARRLGTTPQAHYLSLRLTEAERLVRDTQMALQDVAVMTGFTSQSSFARAFRTHAGQSASALRRAAHQ